MEIAKLNELRNKMHKQFVNRQPADENTTYFYVGMSDGEANKALLMKLIDLVSDRSDNAMRPLSILPRRSSSDFTAHLIYSAV